MSGSKRNLAKLKFDILHGGHKLFGKDCIHSNNKAIEMFNTLVLNREQRRALASTARKRSK